MHIVVCVKQVPDPEISPRDFRLDPHTNRPVQAGARLVMDSYAENALEMAIQLRDASPGATVTALCLGDKPADEVLRRALAFTANAAVRVWDPSGADLDGPAVAHVLGRAIQAIGGADLILTGRQASDVEQGLVGPIMAEELDIPSVSLISQIEIAAGRGRVVRETEDGHAVVSVALPAVFTITSSNSNAPRLPKTRDVMMARSKPIRLLGLADIGVKPERLSPGVQLERALVPQDDSQCEILTGVDGTEQASRLVGRLQELKVL